jgi:hypothetical protein
MARWNEKQLLWSYWRFVWLFACGSVDGMRDGKFFGWNFLVIFIKFLPFFVEFFVFRRFFICFIQFLMNFDDSISKNLQNSLKIQWNDWKEIIPSGIWPKNPSKFQWKVPKIIILIHTLFCIFLVIFSVISLQNYLISDWVIF